MAHDHKSDPAMDQALARSLREKLDTSGKDCPDAALLAAYFDRALPPAETSRWETHFSACARCQEQLAVLARTEPELVDVSAAAPSPFRRFWAARWLAPLATAAAVFALWVAVRPIPPTVTTPPVSEVTQPAAERSLPAAAAAPDAKPATKSAVAEQFGKDAARDKADANVRGAYGQPAGGKLQDAAPAPKKPAVFDEVQASRARDRAPTVAMERKAEEGQTKVGSAQSSAQTSRAQAAPPASPPVGQLPAQKETEVAAAQSPAVGRMDPDARRNAALAQKNAEPDAAEKRREAARPDAPPRQEETVPAEKSATSELRKKQAAAESQDLRAGALAFRPLRMLASAPGGKVQWRFGAGGMIQKSRDAGKTWMRQATPVTADLHAGSAPSADVCWVVGADGTILRTVDGEKWEKVGSPVQAGLQSVSASDAANASVTTADGKTYVTSDGGHTWRQK